MSKRHLAPKTTPTVAPVMVSQLTAIAILGVDERRFLELLVPRCRGVAQVGRLRLVEVTEALRVLRELAPAGDETPAETAAANDAHEERQASTAEEFLASLRRPRAAR